MINLQLREAVDDPNVPGLVSTAEAATIQLEFRYLSFLTDNDTYWDAGDLSLYIDGLSHRYHPEAFRCNVIQTYVSFQQITSYQRARHMTFRQRILSAIFRRTMKQKH